MPSQIADQPLTQAPIPPSTVVRNRLAVVLTEASLLRSQLRIAVRREKEAERLNRLRLTEGDRHV